MPGLMRSSMVFGSGKIHSASVSYIVHKMAWSEPAPPTAGSRLEGLAGLAILSTPPFFGAVCANTGQPRPRPAKPKPPNPKTPPPPKPPPDQAPPGPKRRGAARRSKEAVKPCHLDADSCCLPCGVNDAVVGGAGAM